MSKLLQEIKQRKNLTLFAVIATDSFGVIGSQNRIPWRVPSDMRRFKQLTTGGTVLMGRKTYESIGRPLPNRHNIIVSGRAGGHTDETNLIWSSSPESALQACEDGTVIWICGGAEIYRQLMPATDMIYHTVIITECKDGDARVEDLPGLGHLDGWTEVSSIALIKEDGDEFASHFTVHKRTTDDAQKNG